MRFQVGDNVAVRARFALTEFEAGTVDPVEHADEAKQVASLVGKEGKVVRVNAEFKEYDVEMHDPTDVMGENPLVNVQERKLMGHGEKDYEDDVKELASTIIGFHVITITLSGIDHYTDGNLLFNYVTRRDGDDIVSGVSGQDLAEVMAHMASRLSCEKELVEVLGR